MNPMRSPFLSDLLEYLQSNNIVCDVINAGTDEEAVAIYQNSGKTLHVFDIECTYFTIIELSTGEGQFGETKHGEFKNPADDLKAIVAGRLGLTYPAP